MSEPGRSVLVVDDDLALLRAMRIGLRAHGWDVGVARTGEEGLAQVALLQPDVVVLDLGLPDQDGLEVCRRVRGWSQVPIIVLSAAGSESRKVAALDGGADDYVTKPFSMAELEARLRVALRHSADRGQSGEEVLALGALEVDLVHHSATLNGEAMELTGKEFDLLAYLARHAGKVCTHQMLLHEIWGAEYDSEAHYLRVYAHRLRRKLGDERGAVIRTHPGIGYELVTSPERN